MKKRFKSIMCALLALLMVMACVSCKTKKVDKYDPEKVAVRFAIEGQDGVFNPFFSTTAYDSEIAGMTQISMLTVSGKDAEISYGQNEACVTEDYTEVMLDAEMNPIPAGSTEKPTYTRYSFLIKNGIKFSDGTPLTIDDVLFNLYVYLDPVYTGNATIYSTDIVGLAAYRTQDPNIVDSDDESDFNSGFYVTAEARRTAIDQWCQYYLHEINPSVTPGVKPADDSQIKSDIEILKELFKAELYTDYQSASGSIEDMQKEYTIENQWQVFLYNEGVVSRKTDPANNNRFVKDDNGRYVVDFSEYATMINNFADANWQNYLTTNAAATETEKREEAIKDYVINTIVWNKYIETAAGLNYSGIQQVLYSTGASSTIYTRFVAEAKSDYFKEHKGENGQLTVPTVSGITTETVRAFNGKSYNEDYTVLNILINDVDPKAIWNFAFTVAPRHYYSNAATIAAYPITGVEFGSTDFMNNVVKDPDKLGVPVGAGAYRASQMGGLSSDTEYPEAGKFCENNVIYYERNNYFTTLGTGINNAKIKYFRYQVTNSAQTISSLQTDAVDVASPSATANNIAEINKIERLQSVEIKTNGYGYVGINPKYVPDVYVRQAIMHAMDTSLVLNYYPEGSVERLFWPMSKTNWAFPGQGANPYYTLWNADEILSFLQSHGYEQRTIDGNKVLGKTEDGTFKQLTYTFTIPGSSNDHPANIMFETASNLLNSIGFKISVKTDNWALKKLSTGELEVWAAAWSSSIDPDMYQVYHKESTASSPLNWGYDVIKMNQNNKYSYELNLIDELSELIDQGRQTTVQSERKTIYAQALVKVMKLAVEMPTYQRTDMTVFNAEKIDRNTLTPASELGPNNGLFARIWEMDYVK